MVEKPATYRPPKKPMFSEGSPSRLPAWADGNKYSDVITKSPAESWREVAWRRNDHGPTAHAQDEQIIESLRDTTLPVLISKMASDIRYGKTEAAPSDTSTNIRQIIYNVTTDPKVRRDIIGMPEIPLRSFVHQALMNLTTSETPVTAKTRRTQYDLAILEARGKSFEEVVSTVMSLNFKKPEVKLWRK